MLYIEKADLTSKIQRQKLNLIEKSRWKGVRGLKMMHSRRTRQKFTLSNTTWVSREHLAILEPSLQPLNKHGMLYPLGIWQRVFILNALN